jgi:putative ABC transport system permease protein
LKQWQIALRGLARRPGYSLTAISMLILGIGATTALFSIVNTMLLKPLPYPHANRLVSLMEASPSRSKKTSLIAPVRLEDWNRLNRTFEAVAGFYSENVTDTSGSEPERLASRRVSPRFFTVLASAPLIGRTFSQAEEIFGGPGAAVISYGLWTRRFGQSTNTIGRTLVLGGKGYTIVGVMPKEFAASGTDAWLPAQLAPFMMRMRENRFLIGVGRMKPGVTIEQAQADLARIEGELGEQFPQTDKDWSAIVGDLKEQRVGEYRQALLLMFGSVGLLLLIAVANTAGLTLAQLHQREREMAIRSSVGASRGQVIATVMREVLLIAAAGAASGAAVAASLIRVVAKNFADLPRIPELVFDWRALAFAAAASLLAAMIFGIVPAILATRADLAPVLADSSRSVSSGRRTLQRGLVVAQLAVAILLLSSAGLLLRSYYNLTRVDTGFSTANVITFHVGAAWDEDRPRIGRLQQQIIGELQRLPNVESAGFTSFLPATGATLNFPVVLEGVGQTQPQGQLMVGERNVTSGYFQALHVPLVAGEWCLPPAPFAFNSTHKSMVNRRFVDLYAKNQNVIGRHFSWAQSMLPNAPQNEIAGVVGDVREDGLAVATAPYVYDCPTAGSWPDPEYVVRARGNAQSLMEEIRQVVHGIDPHRAVFGMKMLDSLLDDALQQPRLNAALLGLFAGTGMLLAAVGLYSLMTLVVTARRREIGVRMALGADARAIVRLVLGGAGRLLAAGVGLGLAMTVVAERLIKSALFGVSPLDPWTLAGAVGVLAGVSLIAALLPARKAAAVDPLDAIRAE